MNRIRQFFEKRKQRQQARANTQQQPQQQATRTSQPASQPEPRIPQHDGQQSRQQPISAAVGSAHPAVQTRVAQTANTLSLSFVNQTTSSNVHAYVTGQAIDNNNALFLLQADGQTPYYPSSPANTMSALSANCAIPLGAPGNTVNATIPHIAGGRIWFSIDSTLTFYLNPGPALVEPSVTNPSDPNINLAWDFCEFTFNSDQLYANISYVDFVSVPIALTLNTVSSGTQHVSGMKTTGLQTIVSGLNQQSASDGRGWNDLVINKAGTNTPLRVLSPNQGQVQTPNLFSGYFEPYVDEVWTKYSSSSVFVDTQAAAGMVSASVQNGLLTFRGGTAFSKPSSSDILTCSTGPFATGSNAETNAVIPRLAASFNRSTLLSTSTIPAPENTYYQNAITNHYARIVHAANLDGKGYAFPYDDVQPSGAPDLSGKVQAGDPTTFTITVGGGNAFA